MLQGLLNTIVSIADLATDLRQLSACLVRDHVLGEDGTRDLILQKTVGKQTLEHLVQNSLKGLIVLQIIHQGACRTQNLCDLQQLFCGQHCPLDGSLTRRRNILDSSKGRHALHVAKTLGVGGAPQAAQNRGDVRRRHKKPRHGLCSLGGGAILQHGAYFIKFQCVSCLFGKFHR